ncbi:MAG: DUF1761 family protein [Flavobacteriales bacterium]|nr:DUF1761 family protein [Flavobacteriales bacterium]
MNTKVLIAGIATGVFYFFAGWAVYGIALMDFYTAETTVYEGLMKEPPHLGILALSNVVWAFLVTIVADRTGQRSLKGGLITGLWVGLLVMLMFDTSMYAFYNLMSSKLLMVDVLVGTLFTAAGGALAGLILGSGKQA